MDAGKLLFSAGELIRRVTLTTAIGSTVVAAAYAAGGDGDSMVRMLVVAMGLGVVWSGVRKNHR